MPRTRPRFLLRLAAIALASCAILAGIPALAAAATFTVNTTADNEPLLTSCQGAPGDCSLRQAIVRANGLEGPHTIVLPAGHYTLTLKGDSEDFGLTGDLDVNGEGAISIQGAGARTTVIDANGLEDRVFHVLPTESLSLSRLTVANGHAIDQYGGGILAEKAALALDRVAVRGNVSSLSGRGGGLALGESETTISGSLIAENRNSGDGGGLWTNEGDVAIVNTTIANNVVDTNLYPNENWGAYGGGMEISGGNWVMQNVTISGNSIVDNNGGEDGVGSGIEGTPDSGEFVNVIVYGNTGSKVESTSQCSETLEVVGGHNIEEQPLAGEDRCFKSPTDAIVNPLLGPLADNGGETDTMALLSGSPAINAGNLARCPLVDQRGFPRPQFGGCDIGAFEVQPPPPPAPPAKPTIKRSGKVKVKKAGKTFLVKPGFRVSCPAGGPRCTGTIKARAPKPKAQGANASAKKKVLIGKAKFTIAPGKTRALKLKLNRKGAEMLLEAGKLRARFQVRARAGTGPVAKAKATLTLKLPAGSGPN